MKSYSDNSTPKTIQNAQENIDMALISPNVRYNSFPEAVGLYILAAAMGTVTLG